MGPRAVVAAETASVGLAPETESALSRGSLWAREDAGQAEPPAAVLRPRKARSGGKL